jgi:hypothetical protein
VQIVRSLGSVQILQKKHLTLFETAQFKTSLVQPKQFVRSEVQISPMYALFQRSCQIFGPTSSVLNHMHCYHDHHHHRRRRRRSHPIIGLWVFKFARKYEFNGIIIIIIIY